MILSATCYFLPKRTSPTCLPSPTRHPSIPLGRTALCKRRLLRRQIQLRAVDWYTDCAFVSAVSCLIIATTDLDLDGDLHAKRCHRLFSLEVMFTVCTSAHILMIHVIRARISITTAYHGSWFLASQSLPRRFEAGKSLSVAFLFTYSSVIIPSHRISFRQQKSCLKVIARKSPSHSNPVNAKPSCQHQFRPWRPPLLQGN